MVDDLLSAARLEMAGYSLATGDINPVVVEAVEELSAAALASDTRLEADTFDKPVLVELDRDMLRRAINNLVANAIDASPKGSLIRIATRSAGMWRYVGVIDQGPGLSPESITVGNGESNGMGLSIVRQIVAMHGARLAATANPEGGTIVSIALPVTADPQEPSIEASGLPELYE